eukprot:m.38679 g.38679  ORF g.38679 m.38679 type:complete len:398 (-) comp17987_c0_seq1:241-1434(-)
MISSLLALGMASTLNCPSFLSSLNNSDCIQSARMNREHDAETSPAACSTWCCNNPLKCQAWLFHNAGAGQCWVSNSSVDAASCRMMNPHAGEPDFIGESRHEPPSPPPPSPTVAQKQGFSGFLGPHFNCSDAAALALKDSWFYTWMKNAAQYKTCPFGSAAEFAPMINGIGQLANGISGHYKKEWIANNAKYLLGYNEPDYGNGHNHPHMVSPADAAKDWVLVQNLAEELGLGLVSPAVSTTGLNDDGVSPWFDQFFGNCSIVPGCNSSRIDFIAFHDYNGDVFKLQSRANGLMKRYGKPTWLTEFAINKWARIGPNGCDNCNITRAMQDEYMKAALPLLDKCDAVARYAWYSARDKPIADTNSGNLLVWNNSLPTPTSTGTIYKTHAANSTIRLRG